MAEDNGELRLQLSTILSELTSLKREVHGTNQNVATEVKKLKTKKDLRWKFQGNKSQYDFNCDIVDTLKQAEWAIENHKLEHCSDQLKEALDKLHTRNKHIRIADTSAGGWETVRQYESNPIASNSEDESKIFKAENRALKKKKSSHTRSSTSVSAAGTSTSSTPVIPSLGVGFPQSFGRGRFFFFVANTAKPVATVTSGALEQHQVLASHVESTLTTGETVPIPDQQDARRISPQRSTLASDSTKDEYFDLNRFTHDIYEYEQGQKSIIVRNRLKDNISLWRTIGASDFILDVIGNGYKLPLITTPSITFCCNNRSAILNADFVSEAIQDLLDRALIEKCNYSPLVVNPLTVSVQHCGKKRLILDLRVVNKHLWKQKVRFEDIRIAFSYLEKGFYQIKFDLTSAYHFVEIYKPHTEFLGFSWPDKSGNIIYYK